MNLETKERKNFGCLCEELCSEAISMFLGIASLALATTGKSRSLSFFCSFVILYLAFADGDFVKPAHQFSAVLGFGSKFKNDAVSGGDRAFGGHDIRGRVVESALGNDAVLSFIKKDLQVGYLSVGARLSVCHLDHPFVRRDLQMTVFKMSADDLEEFPQRNIRVLFYRPLDVDALIAMFVEQRYIKKSACQCTGPLVTDC